MEASKTIQHEIGGVQNDALRFGLHGVKSDLVGSHPLQSAYESVISPSPLFVLRENARKEGKLESIEFFCLSFCFTNHKPNARVK